MNHSVTVHRVQKKVDSTAGEMEEEKKLNKGGMVHWTKSIERAY